MSHGTTRRVAKIAVAFCCQGAHGLRFMIPPPLMPGQALQAQRAVGAPSVAGCADLCTLCTRVGCSVRGRSVLACRVLGPCCPSTFDPWCCRA
eukprot:11882031-Alexandrium_andersonii.AAC.1